MHAFSSVAFSGDVQTCVYRKRHPYDLVTESPNVIGDGRAIMFLAGAVRLAVQIEEPAGGRERRTSASTHRVTAEGEGACPAFERRSVVPNPVVSMVSVGFEGGHDHPARDPCALAPGRLSSLLALEVVPTRRTTADRGGPLRTHPADEHRESTLGSAAHSWRTA